MLRRSLRLQEMGYYTEEGTPVVSYKEKLWRWRTVCRRGLQHETMTHADEPVTETDEQMSYIYDGVTEIENRLNSRTNWSFGKIFAFILLLLLAGGMTHYIQMCMKLTEVQQEVESLRRHVNMFAPPVNMMANFALESNGARVLHELSSETYLPQEGGMFWDRIFHWQCSRKTQRRVIQGQTSPQSGQCWPFAGDQGHLVIALSHPVPVTHVTLGHIRKSQSPTGSIASAPRVFSVYGMTTAEEEGVFLGTMKYDEDGAQYQTFQLHNPDNGVFRHVRLQVESNWGNVDYTCLYNFRVHAQVS